MERGGDRLSLKDTCAIVGVGLTKLGKKMAGISTMDFALEGCKRAIEDAGLSKDDVDGLLFVHPSQQGERHGFAGRVADLLGISSNFTATVDCGGSTPIALVQMAPWPLTPGCATLWSVAMDGKTTLRTSHLVYHQALSLLYPTEKLRRYHF